MAIDTVRQGQIIKGVAGKYSVKTDDGELLRCFARGKLRENGALYVGDYVDVEVNGKECVIKDVLPRKSMLVRPYVSNIDGIVIVISPVPKPDLLLVDKLIISCIQQGIDCALCVNKCDMPGVDELYEAAKKEYGSITTVILTCAEDGRGVEELKNIISGRYYCLAGQSAVGKSSLVNALVGDKIMETGEIGEKSGRGKHTTRHVEIVGFEDGTKIADTCGFSMFEIPLFDPMFLASYYIDFDKYRENCRFRGCTHTAEECCGVKEAVELGEIPKERYERYLKLYEEFNKRWEKRYG